MYVAYCVLCLVPKQLPSLTGMSSYSTVIVITGTGEALLVKWKWLPTALNLKQLRNLTEVLYRLHENGSFNEQKYGILNYVCIPVALHCSLYKEA